MNGFPYAAMLFDMDGVILDSMGQHAAAWQDVFAGLGWQVATKVIFENEGAMDPEVLARIAQTQNREIPTDEEFKPWMISLLRQQSDIYLQKHSLQVRPYEWSRPALAALSQAQIPFALVTSSSLDMIDRCLDHGLAHYFSVIISRDDVRRHKPHPEPYLTAAKALGVEPEQCLAVENSPAGIRSARGGRGHLFCPYHHFARPAPVSCQSGLPQPGSTHASLGF